MPEAQIPGRPNIDWELGTFKFLQRAKQREVGGMVEATTTAAAYQHHALRPECLQ